MIEKVAIVYQTKIPPERNGIIKPMKPGGYSDSGADIAYSLRKRDVQVITPVDSPDIQNDMDWVFPDTTEGIQSAINKGANIIWLNTVLYKGHPIEDFLGKDIYVVGQIPESVDLYDDKLTTNRLLKENELPIPAFVTITRDSSYELNIPFPLVVKPILGRGSQGVYLVKSKEELDGILNEMFTSGDYGQAVYAEEFLAGEEITITVMPPGRYKDFTISDYWTLPPVRRFNHNNGIAPYNGVVAVIDNSEVLSDEQLKSPAVTQVCDECEKAAALVNARAPIRIDCRANASGKYILFDLNMKPNMTGASRPHRSNQDSLTALAARKIGWDFDDLIYNMLQQYWQ